MFKSQTSDLTYGNKIHVDLFWVTELTVLQYKVKMCSKKTYCKQCRQVNSKGTTTNVPGEKQTYAEQQHVTDIQLF